MQRSSFSDMPCSVARTLDIIGEWWTLLILRDVFYGVRRFEALRSHLGISRKVLTSRLERLTGEGILKKVLYQTHPIRYEYRLTNKGLDVKSSFQFQYFRKDRIIFTCTADHIDRSCFKGGYCRINIRYNDNCDII